MTQSTRFPPRAASVAAAALLLLQACTAAREAPAAPVTAAEVAEAFRVARQACASAGATSLLDCTLFEDEDLEQLHKASRLARDATRLRADFYSSCEAANGRPYCVATLSAALGTGARDTAHRVGPILARARAVRVPTK